VADPRSELQPRETANWLADEFSSQLATVLEAMIGEPPAVAHEPLYAPLTEAGLLWKQPFPPLPGEVWLFAAESDWSGVGRHVLRAAGIEDADGPTLRSTYLETVGQALSGVGQTLSSRLGHEITPRAGAEIEAAPSDLSWVAIRLTFRSGACLLLLGASEVFLRSCSVTVTRESEIGNDGARETKTNPTLAFGNSKTFELLLDVELPVSVSFGRAQVPLKEVLKLTTGSIVELNRSIVEPVEVIVNNCVIARGEVVVIEGNFGVRIHEVISRQERLRTLA
jgi:flagellar motor switch protein FliN